MKIGIFLPSLGHGGAEYSAVTVGLLLRDKWGVEVAIGCPNVPETESLRRYIESFGIRQVPFPIDITQYDNETIFNEHVAQSCEYFAERDFDAIFAPYPWYKRGLGIIAGAAQAGTPAVVKFALLPDDLKLPHYCKSALSEALKQQLWFTNSRHNSRILAQALEVEDGLVDFFHVGPVGLKHLEGANSAEIRPDDARTRLLAELKLKESVKLIVTVARFSEQKGYSVLYEAALAILPKYESVHFVWIGGGELLTEFKQRARADGLDGRIHMLGHRPDVRLLLRGADLFALPTLFEGGCSMAMLEAMDEGLPVVISDIPGVREVSRDQVDAVHFETGSSEALVRKLRCVLDDEDFARKLVQGGKKTSAALSVEQMLASTAQRIWLVACR